MILATVLGGGCGSGLKLLPVTGAVKLDGKPLEGAAVLFAPRNEGPAANAITDAQGRFELHTGNDPGALAGDYRVAISLQEAGAWAGDPHGMNGSPAPGAPSGKWITPKKYAGLDTSGLSAEVTHDQLDFQFELVRTTP